MGKIRLRNTECREAIGTLLLLLILTGCAHRDRLSAFDYSHRPAGYNWTPRSAALSNDIVYYGVDPRTHWTVYVGPDGLYYTFPHSGDIAPSDFDSYWNPHDATAP